MKTLFNSRQFHKALAPWIFLPLFISSINLKLTNDEIVQHLRNSFLENKPNINFKNIAIDNKK